MVNMKLVLGTGAGSLASCKSAEAEEMWLKRIAQAVADLCWWGDRASVGIPVVLKVSCLMLKQFSWLVGKLKISIAHSLMCWESKAYFGTHGKICISFVLTSVYTGKDEIKTTGVHPLCLCSWQLESKADTVLQEQNSLLWRGNHEGPCLVHDLSLCQQNHERK